MGLYFRLGQDLQGIERGLVVEKSETQDLDWGQVSLVGQKTGVVAESLRLLTRFFLTGGFRLRRLTVIKNELEQPELLVGGARKHVPSDDQGAPDQLFSGF